MNSKTESKRLRPGGDAPPPVGKGDAPPAWAKSLIADVAALKAAVTHGSFDPLDALEKELDGNGEDNVTVPAGALSEKLKREKERENAKAYAAEVSPTVDSAESRQAAYDSRNPHMKPVSTANR